MAELKLTKNACLTWQQRVSKNNSHDILVIFLQLCTSTAIHSGWISEMDGEYVIEYKNKNITAVVKGGNIIYFKVKSLLDITAHAYSRWRDRVDKNSTNKEIYKIFEGIDYNNFDPTKDGKYIIEYNKKEIKAVIKGKKIITFIV